MTKVIATIAVFTSFEEIAQALARYGEKVPIPENPSPGIHMITMYDDGECGTFQHMLAVVVGDFEEKWYRRGTPPGRSPLGPEIITVEFSQGDIPIFMGGKEVTGDTSTHSLYSPKCHCVRLEKIKLEKVCVKYVEARTSREVEDILTCERSEYPCDIVDLNLYRKFSERFLWKDDKKAMEGITEASCGPYNYLVLFIKEA